MDSYLTQPLPLITPRVEFALQSAGNLPVITNRMDFTTLGLRMPNGNAHATPVNDNESDIEVDNTSDIEMDDLPLAASSLTRNQTYDDFSSLSESENDDQRQKICKPVGEPGRPKSGGYTLEKQIASWGSDTIAKVNAFVRSHADKSLATTQSYRNQEPLRVKRICIEVAKHYPIVDKYHNQWPVRDMLKLYLKSTSAAHRQAMKLLNGNKKGKGRSSD